MDWELFVQIDRGLFNACSNLSGETERRQASGPRIEPGSLECETRMLTVAQRPSGQRILFSNGFFSFLHSLLLAIKYS